MKALRVVTRPEHFDGVFRDRSRQRHVGERTAIRSPELECPVG
jgi:hypothetical protein